MNWRPGDELITTDQEHQGGLVPAYMAGQRYRLTVRVVDVGLGDGAFLAALEEAISPRTRLISLSHVSWLSGARLPLAEIVALAHRHQILVVADGAQAAGAMPVDVRQLGVDMYAVPGQKWLCGPEGMGALYVRRGRIGELAPTFAGYRTLASGLHMDFAGAFQLAPGARRYEVGTTHGPSLQAMRESLRWLEEAVGWPWAFARIAQLAAQAAELLNQVPDVRVQTPANRAGLISFSVDGLAPQEVVSQLAERGIMIRAVPFVDWLRVSTGFFNTEEDLLRLRDALLEILSTRPS
jgi:L-cysteine/cystine lyase